MSKGKRISFKSGRRKISFLTKTRKRLTKTDKKFLKAEKQFGRKLTKTERQIIKRIRKPTRQQLAGAGLVAGGSALILGSSGFAVLPGAAAGTGLVFTGLRTIKEGKRKKIITKKR